VKYTVTSYKGRPTIVLDTNILTRLMEELRCESNTCKDLITSKIFCGCRLNVDVIIPKESLKEMKKCLRTCLQLYVKQVALGGRRIKHGIYLRSLKDSSKELRRNLRNTLPYREYKEASREVADKADKSLINISLVKAYDFKKKKGSILVLLTMDKKLREKVHDLASKVNLINYIVIPDISQNTLNECFTANCPIECVLKAT
jgi:hypothetical protein